MVNNLMKFSQAFLGLYSNAGPAGSLPAEWMLLLLSNILGVIDPCEVERISLFEFGVCASSDLKSA